MSRLQWIGYVLVWVGLLFAFYLSYRNALVFQFRSKLISQIGAFISAELSRYEKRTLESVRRGERPDDFPPWLKLYELLPDYNHMMRRFWVWPLSRFGTFEELKRKVCP